MASTDRTGTTTTDESVSTVLATLQQRRAAMLDGDVDALARKAAAWWRSSPPR